ncbi:MAG TPA: hypothetical protein PLC89_01675 [Haliscomenobacter sp.]|uniref:hypothetical protein n=1 Tax=Haliscomenobacter sp. TaxID=2717303 RepID=UPI002CF4FAEB|nr:hypothetical protein [Haliscomenobacter sp.]HOY15965.1 hypothetical protein [Haliscomenobacter sp.]HPH18345.1 hypothetical protein [Haliscomenobacter sp.]
MKKTLPGLLFAALLLVSCQNTPKQTDPESTEPRSGGKPPTKTSCYELRFGPDLTAIELTVVGDEVSGFMAWEPDQKDGARGMFKGQKVGDEITAVFDYMIEGSIQSEEVVFKMEGDKLLQGRGEMDDNNGQLTFKDKSKLDWEETFSLTDCANIKESIARAVDMYGMIQKQKGN